MEFPLAKRNKHIEALFDRLFQLLGVSDPGSGHEFLKSLRGDARSNKRNWQERLNEYLNSLQDQGKLSESEIDELLALASECPVPPPRKWVAWSPLIWLIFGAFAVLGITTYNRTSVQSTVFIAAVAAAGAYTGWLRNGRPKRQKPPGITAWERPACAALYAVASVAIAVLIPLLSQVSYFEYLRHGHAARSNEFRKDPDGMVAFQNLAKVHYGIDVVLNDPDDDWVGTTLALKGASPAFIDTNAGYCVLSFDSSSLRLDFGIENPRLMKAWTKGILMHEMGHCLDISRDQRGFGEKSSLGSRSIAPSISQYVYDVQSYADAANKDSSKLWREAYADIVAIGYWKIAEPDSHTILTANLRAERVKNVRDTIHRTMCWIDAAKSKAAPASMENLPAWADDIRSKTRCPGV
ncbi:hypothetical protein RugamoR57_18010 [Duganella caerulea]|uniref:hypothetical protein n=1 Tax=Duganella caerulea TaxID=2885762 RepID=UPI0030E8744E